MTTLESKITIPKDVLFRDVDGEAVILNMETGKYFGLDPVGTRMWALLDEHRQVEPAFRALIDEYEIAPDQLLRDLLDLIDTLASHKLVQVDEV